MENALNAFFATGSTSLVAAGLAGVAPSNDVGETRRAGARLTYRF
ncbi:MAG: hypothetical protein ACFB2Z_03275 [Maricaulaceae bacterium]